METGDLITSFFNNEMTPEQERQFLLSVASSDSLRLGLKSHVMLDRIVGEQMTRTTVPGSVRALVLKEAAVAAAAVRQPEVGSPQGASGFRAPAQGRVPSWWSRPAALTIAALMAVGSFFAGYVSGTDDDPIATTPGEVVLPATTTAAPARNGIDAPDATPNVTSASASDAGRVNEPGTGLGAVDNRTGNRVREPRTSQRGGLSADHTRTATPNTNRSEPAAVNGSTDANAQNGSQIDQNGNRGSSTSTVGVVPTIVKPDTSKAASNDTD